MNPRRVVAVALLPSALLALATIYEILENWGRPQRLLDVAMWLFMYVPLALHVPMWVGAYRLYRHGKGGHWLQMSVVPVTALAVFLGPGEGLLVTAPFIVGAALAWWVGRHLHSHDDAPFPDLPDDPSR